MGWRKELAGLCTFIILSNAMGSLSVRADESISGKLTVWEHSITFEMPMEMLVSGFEEKYPNVDVEWEIWDMENYYDLVSLGIQAGSGPDLFYTDGIARTKMREYTDQGTILNLTDLVDFSNFDEADLWREEIDGKCYGVPWLTFDSRIVYYNVEMFQENNWKIPETFAEFEELLGKIKDTGITPISLTPYDSYSLLFLMEPILTALHPEYAENITEDDTDLLAEPVKEAIQKMLDWAAEGYFGDWTEVLNGGDQGLNFMSGNAAMNICGSWDATNMQANNPDLEIDAFILPSNDGSKGLMGSIASGFSLNAETENRDAAIAFLNYCASLDGQSRWIRAHGGISADESIEASTEIAKKIQEQAENNLFTSWEMVMASRSSAAVDIWEKGFVELFLGKITLENLCERLASVIG